MKSGSAVLPVEAPATDRELGSDRDTKKRPRSRLIAGLTVALVLASAVTTATLAALDAARLQYCEINLEEISFVPLSETVNKEDTGVGVQMVLSPSDESAFHNLRVTSTLCKIGAGEPGYLQVHLQCVRRPLAAPFPSRLSSDRVGRMEPYPAPGGEQRT